MNEAFSNIKTLFHSQVKTRSSLAKSTHNERKQKLKRLLKNFMEKKFLFLKITLLRFFPDHSKFSYG